MKLKKSNEVVITEQGIGSLEEDVSQHNYIVCKMIKIQTEYRQISKLKKRRKVKMNK